MADLKKTQTEILEKKLKDLEERLAKYLKNAKDASTAASKSILTGLENDIETIKSELARRRVVSSLLEKLDQEILRELPKHEAIIEKSKQQLEKSSESFLKIHKSYSSETKEYVQSISKILNNVYTENVSTQDLKFYSKNLEEMRSLFDQLYEDNNEKKHILDQFEIAQKGIGKALRKRTNIFAKTAGFLHKHDATIMGTVGMITLNNPLALMLAGGVKNLLTRSKEQNKNMEGIRARVIRAKRQGLKTWNFDEDSGTEETKQKNRELAGKRIYKRGYLNENILKELSYHSELLRDIRILVAKSLDNDAIYAHMMEKEMNETQRTIKVGDERLVHATEPTPEEILEGGRKQKGEGLRFRETPKKEEKGIFSALFGTLKDFLLGFISGTVLSSLVPILLAGLKGLGIVAIVGSMVLMIKNQLQNAVKNAKAWGATQANAITSQLILPAIGFIVGSIIAPGIGSVVGTMAGIAANYLAGPEIANIYQQWSDRFQSGLSNVFSAVESFWYSLTDNFQIGITVITGWAQKVAYTLKYYLLQTKKTLLKSMKFLKYLPIVGPGAELADLVWGGEEGLQETEQQLYDLENTRRESEKKHLEKLNEQIGQREQTQKEIIQQNEIFQNQLIEEQKKRAEEQQKEIQRIQEEGKDKPSTFADIFSNLANSFENLQNEFGENYNKWAAQFNRQYQRKSSTGIPLNQTPEERQQQFENIQRKLASQYPDRESWSANSVESSDRRTATSARIAPAQGASDIDKLYGAVLNPETGSKLALDDPRRFIRTKAGAESSAYGPAQITKTLAQTYMERGLFKDDPELQQYAERFVAQGRKMLRSSYSDPTYGAGGKGELSSEEDRATYGRFAKRIMQAELDASGGDLNRFIRKWRGVSESQDPGYYASIRNTMGGMTQLSQNVTEASSAITENASLKSEQTAMASNRQPVVVNAPAQQTPQKGTNFIEGGLNRQAPRGNEPTLQASMNSDFSGSYS